MPDNLTVYFCILKFLIIEIIYFLYICHSFEIDTWKPVLKYHFKNNPHKCTSLFNPKGDLEKECFGFQELFHKNIKWLIWSLKVLYLCIATHCFNTLLQTVLHMIFERILGTMLVSWFYRWQNDKCTYIHNMPHSVSFVLPGKSAFGKILGVWNCFSKHKSGSEVLILYDTIGDEKNRNKIMW